MTRHPARQIAIARRFAAALILGIVAAAAITTGHLILTTALALPDTLATAQTLKGM